FLATAWGPKPAVAASLLAAASFNYFFLPPVGTFTIADPHNWVAILAFLITAVIVGQLSARVKRQAIDAEDARIEIERLYRELKESFEEASQAKALRQSERLKSALLDAVTHDLRTPLTSIKASITTLMDEVRRPSDNEDAKLDQESKLEMMEVIDEESDRLNRFIGDLIALARIEAGEMQLSRRWGAISEITSSAIRRAQPLTKQHGIVVDVSEDIPDVSVDERALSEVFYTLIDNAAKFSPADSVIRISAERVGDAEVRMAVEDEGTGIPTELREHVFDKFFRASRNGDISRRRTGTGMGLAIAKGIVEAHGGRIWAEAGTAGRGTRIVFTMPIGARRRNETSL
ncbi:MAG TPA: ATP-binding protein, partial [Pyrinomonadaceae bacterium]|nr:ATP-binding protein [Pyrinomonadaceae bacterium]